VDVLYQKQSLVDLSHQMNEKEGAKKEAKEEAEAVGPHLVIKNANIVVKKVAQGVIVHQLVLHLKNADLVHILLLTHALAVLVEARVAANVTPPEEQGLWVEEQKVDNAIAIALAILPEILPAHGRERVVVLHLPLVILRHHILRAAQVQVMGAVTRTNLNAVEGVVTEERHAIKEEESTVIGIASQEVTTEKVAVV
jgi:hypothetical protein